MIEPKDVVSKSRMPNVAGSNYPSNENSALLNAPLANFDDGFSSDQGGFVSGAETEREVTDREDSPDRTPVRELARESFQSPVSIGETDGTAAHAEDDDIVKTAKITISPPKDLASDEAKASLLSHQHDSTDMDVDEASDSSSPGVPQRSNIGFDQASPISHGELASGSGSPNLINQQLRQQYEIQAITRPRPTTPVSACAIESFVAVNPRRISDAEKMKISLPSSSFANAAPAVELQLEEAKQPSATGPQRMHRRRSSMSWTEFQENMASSSYYSASGTASGRASGRTTPVSSSVDQDDHDLFEQNPSYQDRVPPSPVVHRRASREWVDFEEFANGERKLKDDIQHPPLSELVTEIQQTVDAWQKDDDKEICANIRSHEENVPKLEKEYEFMHEQEEQYPPPPFDAGISLYEQQEHTPYDQKLTNHNQQYYGQDQAVYGQMDFQQYQEPPQEPFYDYSNYAPVVPGQQRNYYDSNKSSAYELDANYPPPPPAPTRSLYMDEWSSQLPSASGTSYEAATVYDKSGTHFDPTPASQYGQSASTNDDWDTNPYAQLQLSYQQQAPPEPTQRASVDDESTPAASVRAAPAPPPSHLSTTKAEPEPAAKEEKPAASEEWLAYERMTQKMNMVVKQTQEKLQEMQKESVAKVLPRTPYEIALGKVAQSPPQQQPTADTRASPASVDLLTSDFEPDSSITKPSDQATTPQSSAGEWKPIHEVLNEEIKKQKELQKPKRPPPPKGAPPRPPRPTPVNAIPSWDDETTVSAPSVAVTGRIDPTKIDWDAPAEGSYAITTAIVPTLSNEAPIDYSSKKDYPDFETDTFSSSTSAANVVPVSFDSTDLVRGKSVPHADHMAMDNSIPFTSSDIANQNHLKWNEKIEDDALFDTSKYNKTISGEYQTNQVSTSDDFNIFLKSDKGLTSPPNMPLPPIPPPRSPGPERKFVIEKSVSPPKVTTPAAAHWADFDNTENKDIGIGTLPPSESDFYLKMTAVNKVSNGDPFAPQIAPKQPTIDLLGSVDNMEESYDPFAVKSPEQIVAEAKAKAQAQLSAQEAVEDLDFFGGGAMEKGQDDENAEDKEGRISPSFGFRDDFAPAPSGDVGADDDEDGMPLYDEDDSKPLLEFPPKFTGDGWDMMLRFPVKKKMMAERCWKPVYVRLQGTGVELYYGKNDRLPFQTLPLLANYCLSDVTTQQYDVYGKIHTVKLQYVIYKEKVGIRPGQIPKLVEGHFTKLGLPLEHAAQTSVLLKFGSLHHDEMQTFVYAVEDVLFRIAAVRERPAMYKQDEIQVHCYDEYASHVNKDGVVSDQRARVRLFCLAFVSGMPFTEIGLNDRRRQGKEVVRRKDIMPMYTERWIRFEALEFHSSVDKASFDKDHVIRMKPLDACFFELLRFRVRPPRGKELPLHVRSIMKIAGSKIEIRIEAMVAVFKSRKARQVPCEDIQIRFPIPEAWIYLFREERHWGYGSVHAKVRRPGKVKNFKDKIMGMVQNTETSLIEVAIGDAKYEHVYRSLVWRIPRLPEKHHGAYKTHLLRCRFELSSFDLMPETFIPNCEVEYTMPMATVSHTVVRSVSIEQHEDPDKVEKWVRYLAKYQYTVEIDYVQTTDLDIEAIMDTTVLDPEKSMEKAPVKHQPSLDIGVAKDAHEGYRIDFTAAELGGGRYEKTEGNDGRRKSSSDSSDDDDRGSRKAPLIQIDIKNYKY